MARRRGSWSASDHHDIYTCEVEASWGTWGMDVETEWREISSFNLYPIETRKDLSLQDYSNAYAYSINDSFSEDSLLRRLGPFSGRAMVWYRT